MDTTDKTSIVTGASSGIGLGIVRALLERGDTVIGNARTRSRLDRAATELGSPARFILVEGDIGRAEVAKRLFETALAKTGRVDLLVNNAGIFIAKPTAQYDVDEVEQMISTNLKGFFYPSQQAAIHMGAQKSGSIINISAALASQPLAQVPALLAVLIKGGIDRATRALALELAPAGGRGQPRAPGLVDTPMYKPDMHEFLKSLSPLHELGAIDDIVQAVLYLADAPFTTGVTLPVDGGMTAGRW